MLANDDALPIRVDAQVKVGDVVGATRLQGTSRHPTEINSYPGKLSVVRPPERLEWEGGFRSGLSVQYGKFDLLSKILARAAKMSEAWDRPPALELRLNRSVFDCE